jgi:hypothetical protein
VYITAGCSSKTSGGDLNHPVMIASLEQLGSVVLDIVSNRLDATFIDDTGATRDFFTMVKGAAAISASEIPLPTSIRAQPNPFTADTRVSFALPASGSVVVKIVDVTGRTVRTLLDGARPEGAHHVRWDGRDDAGQSVAAGIYVAVLEHDGTRRAVKIARTR